jgi:hypothetical protein
MKIHLICVANGATQACKEYFRNVSRGSLPFSTDLNFMKEIGMPTEFHITDYDKSKTFIHVFDDFTFPFVLDELDTLMDFVDYLTEKEIFLRKAKSVYYTGEEDLLLHYMINFDSKRQCHTFVNEFKVKFEETNFGFQEENWNEWKKSHQYKAKIEANKVSYIWDSLIQKTAHGILAGTTISEKTEGSTHEGAVRYMALENRTQRRLLSERMISSFHSYPIEKCNSSNFCYASVVYDKSGTAYFFLQLNLFSSGSYENYRKHRKSMLEAYGFCLKAKFVSETPKMKLNKIIGIALEPPKCLSKLSEDFVLIDCSNWTNEQQKEFDSIRREFNIWRTSKDQYNYIEIQEYPDVDLRQIKIKQKIGRNDKCPCGSGKKYKKCCLGK